MAFPRWTNQNLTSYEMYLQCGYLFNECAVFILPTSNALLASEKYQRLCLISIFMNVCVTHKKINSITISSNKELFMNDTQTTVFSLSMWHFPPCKRSAFHLTASKWKMATSYASFVTHRWMKLNDVIHWPGWDLPAS